ncbi:hypothetical protein HOG48_03445 [Candidatus Peregrinibacteria bacterium]|jgi:hypothetical protein|nr:hypothetical protein [Candidatus Peregrinibacteria bacterium]
MATPNSVPKGENLEGQKSLTATPPEGGESDIDSAFDKLAALEGDADGFMKDIQSSISPEEAFLASKLDGVKEYMEAAPELSAAVTAMHQNDVVFNEAYFILAPEFLQEGGKFDLEGLGVALNDIYSNIDQSYLQLMAEDTVTQYVYGDGAELNEERYDEVYALAVTTLAQKRAENPGMELSVENEASYGPVGDAIEQVEAEIGKKMEGQNLS